MRLVPLLIALVLAASDSTSSIARAQTHDYEMLPPQLQPPMPSAVGDVVAGEPVSQPPALMPDEAAEPIFAPPHTTVEAPPRHVYRRVRPRPRITPPGAYDGYYNYYDDPHTVHYWSPNLPYYDPTYGYNSYRPLPPKSRHYRGPANPHNTGWGISY
jgi:hypothetical protein